MFDSVKVRSSFALLAALWLLSSTVVSAASESKRFGLGTPITEQDVAVWNIDIRPDGAGLPDGGGSALDGEDIYIERCSACHGEFGEGAGRYPVLIGGEGSLDSHDPVKTIGSYWPYASTVFDYIKRAMPFGQAQTLSDDEVYAITAYLLAANEIIDEDFVLNKTSLPTIVMPNVDGFIEDDRPHTGNGAPCMHQCRDTQPQIIGKARELDVTPQKSDAVADESSEAQAIGDVDLGERVFAQCSACHSLAPEEHRVGPSLHGLVGRKAGSATGFGQYSQAMQSAGIDWIETNIDRYLESPQSLVKGTSMPFAGIKDAQERAHLIAYLKQATAP